MTSWAGWAAVLASASSGVIAAGLLRSTPRGLFKPNYAGRPVPAVLGLALVPGVGVGAGLASWFFWPSPSSALPEIAALFALGAAAVAGMVDDLSSGGPKGLRGHLTSLLSGRPTTGILKLGVGVAAGVLLALLLGGGAPRIAAAALLMAASLNVWNALDVVPGRAIKWSVLPLALALVAGWSGPTGLLAGATLGAAIGVLPFDLLERGMLGDAGSNPLGLSVGFGLAATLPTASVVLAAVAVLALQVVAETVTISRLVEATPLLRWLDRLGRRA